MPTEYIDSTGLETLWSQIRAADALSVAKTGDTMTGLLTIDGNNLIIKSDLYPTVYLLPQRDNTTNRTVFEGSAYGASSFQSWEDSAGNNRRILEIRTKSNQTSLDNAVVLRTCDAGTWNTYQIFHSGSSALNISGQISADKSSSYYNGRDYAMIRNVGTNNTSMYRVLTSGQSNTGSWETAVYNDRYHFTWVTDTVYDSGVNTNYKTWYIDNTGLFTGFSTGINTSNTAGYITDTYGNFKHQSTTNTDNWNIFSNSGTSNFKVNYETGVTTINNGLYIGSAAWHGLHIRGASTSNAIALLNTGNTLTIDLQANGATAPERYILPTPSSLSTQVWYNILTDKASITLPRGNVWIGSTTNGAQGLRIYTEMSANTTVSSYAEKDKMQIYDSDDAKRWRLRAINQTDGRQGIGYSLSRGSVTHGFNMYIDSSGNRSVYLDDPASWRTALGVKVFRGDSGSNAPSAVSVSSGTRTTVAQQINLGTGYYLFTVFANFPSNATGYREVLVSNSSTGSQMDKFTYYVTPATSGGVTSIVFSFYDVISSGTKSYYVRVTQNSGSTLSVTGGIKYMKLADYT